jgi:hypothetical protein
MGLLFVPLSLFIAFNCKGIWAYLVISLFIAFNCKGIWAYLVIFLFTSFLLSIHAPSAIIVVIVLIPYILLNLRGNFKHALGIGLAVIVPFLAPFPWIFSMLGPTAQRLLTPQSLPTYIDFPRIMQDYGYLPIAICLFGTFLLAVRGDKKNYGLLLGLLALLIMLVTFFVFHYGLSVMYERGLMFMMLMVSIVAGAGLAGVKNLTIPANLASRLKIPLFVSKHTGKALCLVLVAVTLVVTIPDRQDIAYYYMIEDADYQAFVWIKENVSDDYKVAILDPWKATAFTAVTGKNTYTRTHSFPLPRDEEAGRFLDEGCTDTEFLKENGISIIYQQGECQNPDLIQVSENVYLLPKKE